MISSCTQIATWGAWGHLKSNDGSMRNWDAPFPDPVYERIGFLVRRAWKGKKCNDGRRKFGSAFSSCCWMLRGSPLQTCCIEERRNGPPELLYVVKTFLTVHWAGWWRTSGKTDIGARECHNTTNQQAVFFRYFAIPPWYKYIFMYKRSNSSYIYMGLLVGLGHHKVAFWLLFSRLDFTLVP
jgi:hypothetical protein